jgi:putative transposase
MDNLKAYIHIVMDNFSRAILAWGISLEQKAVTTLNTLKKAYDSYIYGNENLYPEVQIMSDGGSENMVNRPEISGDSFI